MTLRQPFFYEAHLSSYVVFFFSFFNFWLFGFLVFWSFIKRYSNLGYIGEFVWGGEGKKNCK
jgi:hypothetical protein